MSRAPPKPSPNDASGSLRNEYIPNFISKKPFYIDDNTLSESDYLEHQRLQSLPQDTLSQSKWYDRGRKLGPAATRFRKGACENCGAMTHKTKECLSRPRKQGAKWTGRDIQADEVVEDVKLGWDAKRDRWNGYDAREYSTVVKEYEELESLKKAAVDPDGQQKRLENDDEADEDTNDPEIESAKYAEETDMGRNQPTSTRNLRIREDTAKYLVNLDLNSAKYDPKTRSMADVVVPPGSDPASTNLADENFTRSTSDAAEFERAQRYAWETQEKDRPGTQKLHLQANPTEGEILRKNQTAEAAAKKEASRKALLEKYGGAEHLQPTPFRAAENERYVEYDESGGVKGEVKKLASSQYREDVLVNNHTSTWGSWWANFKWGYACCHSVVKNSYCTGEEGRIAFEEAETRRRAGDLLLERQQQHEEDEEDKESGNGEVTGELVGSGDNGKEGREEQEQILKSAVVVAAAAKKQEQEQEQKQKQKQKKRTLQEMRDGVTEEELEEFKRNRATVDDPMARFLGKDELVH